MIARVTGIGGIFLKAEKPEQLAAWYAQTLDLTRTPYSAAGCNKRRMRCGESRHLFWSIGVEMAASLAVHTGGFSECDAHAFNRHRGRLAAYFLYVREGGASLH